MQFTEQNRDKRTDRATTTSHRVFPHDAGSTNDCTQTLRKRCGIPRNTPEGPA
jgi:hypothetical protein